MTTLTLSLLVVVFPCLLRKGGSAQNYSALWNFIFFALNLQEYLNASHRVKYCIMKSSVCFFRESKSKLKISCCSFKHIYFPSNAVMQKISFYISYIAANSALKLHYIISVVQCALCEIFCSKRYYSKIWKPVQKVVFTFPKCFLPWKEGMGRHNRFIFDIHT